MATMKRAAVGSLVALTVLIVAGLAVESYAQSSGPTDTQCANAWTSSSASGSCGQSYDLGGLTQVNTNTYTAEARNGQCYVNVDCKRNWGTPINNEFNGTTAEVESLSNCDGYLRKGSC